MYSVACSSGSTVPTKLCPLLTLVKLPLNWLVAAILGGHNSQDKYTTTKYSLPRRSKFHTQIIDRQSRNTKKSHRLLRPSPAAATATATAATFTVSSLSLQLLSHFACHLYMHRRSARNSRK